MKFVILGDFTFEGRKYFAGKEIDANKYSLEEFKIMALHGKIAIIDETKSVIKPEPEIAEPIVEPEIVEPIVEPEIVEPIVEPEIVEPELKEPTTIFKSKKEINKINKIKSKKNK